MTKGLREKAFCFFQAGGIAIFTVGALLVNVESLLYPPGRTRPGRAQTAEPR
jgi:hypothetical protein